MPSGVSHTTIINNKICQMQPNKNTSCHLIETKAVRWKHAYKDDDDDDDEVVVVVLNSILKRHTAGICSKSHVCDFSNSFRCCFVWTVLRLLKINSTRVIHLNDKIIIRFIKFSMLQRYFVWWLRRACVFACATEAQDNAKTAGWLCVPLNPFPCQFHHFNLLYT